MTALIVVVCLAAQPTQCMTRQPGIAIDASACRTMAALGTRRARYAGKDATVRIRCGG